MDWNEIYFRQIDNGFDYNGFAAIFLGGLRIPLLTWRRLALGEIDSVYERVLVF